MLPESRIDAERNPSRLFFTFGSPSFGHEKPCCATLKGVAGRVHVRYEFVHVVFWSPAAATTSPNRARGFNQ